MPLSKDASSDWEQFKEMLVMKCQRCFDDRRVVYRVFGDVIGQGGRTHGVGHLRYSLGRSTRRIFCRCGIHMEPSGLLLGLRPRLECAEAVKLFLVFFSLTPQRGGINAEHCSRFVKGFTACDDATNVLAFNRIQRKVSA